MKTNGPLQAIMIKSFVVSRTVRARRSAERERGYLYPQVPGPGAARGRPQSGY